VVGLRRAADAGGVGVGHPQMRPPFSLGRPADLPRWRQRRADDLQGLAFAYGAALTFFVGLLGIVCFVPGGLAHRGADFTSYVLVGFCVVTYLAAGGLVVALAIRRLAFWTSRSPNHLTGINWLLVLFWPIAIGVLLLRGAIS
jgi:hypothetical protein